MDVDKVSPVRVSRAHDSELAGKLVNILSDAQQEVPDCLKNAGGAGGDFGDAEFGGVDVRPGAAPAEAESWD